MYSKIANWKWAGDLVTKVRVLGPFQPAEWARLSEGALSVEDAEITLERAGRRKGGPLSLLPRVAADMRCGMEDMQVGEHYKLGHSIVVVQAVGDKTVQCRVTGGRLTCWCKPSELCRLDGSQNEAQLHRAPPARLARPGEGKST